MSTTGPLVVNEVWRILQDTGLEHVVSEDPIRQAVVRQVAFLADYIGIGSAWVSAAITTATNSRDYTLSQASEYLQLLGLRYASDKRPLHKTDDESVLDQQGFSSGTGGRQYVYGVRNGAAQEVIVSFPAFPSVVEDIDARVSLVPTNWPIGSTTAPSIPFSTTAVRALELLAASAIFKTLGEDKLTSLDLNPNSGKDWFAEGMALATTAQLQIIRLKRSQGIDLPYDTLYTWGQS